jgi:NAD(P)-dependent dehydrogenase (short-subunit alcohol dehydrogenase family)
VTKADFDLREAEAFADSVAIITGGTSGVGLATARRLADAGVPRLLLVGRTLERGAAAVEELAERGVEAVFHAADVTVASEAHGIVAVAVNRWGRVDIVVNSTNGIGRPTLLYQMETNSLAPVVLSQLSGPMHMTHAVRAIMAEQGSGAIVNIASDAAKSPTPGEAAIGAAMAGVVMFSRTAAMELKRNGIRVNVVTPSLVTGTGGYDRVQSDEFSTKLFSKAIPAAQLGLVDAEDMAELIVFLCSPRSGKLTGQAISLNGGISAL